MKKKNETHDLYNAILRNAQTGLGTTAHLLALDRSDAMTEALRKQHAGYTAFVRRAEDALRARGERPKGLSRAEKWRTDVGVSMNLMLDRSDSHAAQMMMTGSAMGVADAQRALHRHGGADPDAGALMQQLSDFEQATVEEMKPFL